MFEIDMLPAQHGDALWVTWSDPQQPRHLLVDGGPNDRDVQAALRRRIDERLATRGGSLELLVITHIDSDHIAGALRLLQDGVGVPVGDVWFNGYHHLAPADVLGAVQAEAVSATLTEKRLPWNAALAGRAVCLPEDETHAVTAVDLAGGLRVTVLGPSTERLRQLKPVWETECRKAGIIPGVPPVPDVQALPADVLGETPNPEVLVAQPFRADPSRANGASIVLLAEYEGRAALLTGDAWAVDVVDGMRRLEAERRNRTKVDVVKVPHHGSRGNVTTELVEAVGATTHLFSSSGKQFGHPHQEAVARVVLGASERGAELRFNYRSEFSEVWDSRDLKSRYGYSTVYADGRDGLSTPLV